MLAETKDDYVVLLQYVRITENANIVLAFDKKASFLLVQSLYNILLMMSHILSLIQNIFHLILILYGFLIRSWFLMNLCFQKSQ